MSLPPSSPSEPSRTTNPRSKFQVGQRTYPLSGRTASFDSESASERNRSFLHQIDSFLETELANTHSDADRVHVYQRAFDLLAQEFQLCRPLLERIKQQYDEMGRNLLEKKRVIMTDSSSVSAVEDSFSEQVNRMRRAREQEFGRMRQDTEHLLDEMTACRVQRSDLLQQMAQLEEQREQLKIIEQDNAEKMTQVNSRVHELIDEIKQMESDIAQAKKDIAALDEKIEKTMISSTDLIRSDQQLSEELANLEGIEKGLKEKLFNTHEASRSLDLDLQELHREIRSLTHENEDAREKLRNIRDRKATNEQKMREMLKPYEPDPKVPIIAILKKLLARKRR
jgi:chromosome segregation ATPase